MKMRNLFVFLVIAVLFATPVFANGPEYKVSVYPKEIYDGNLAIKLEQKSNSVTSYTLEGSWIDYKKKVSDNTHFNVGFGARRYFFGQDMNGLYLSPIFLAEWKSGSTGGTKTTDITVMGVAAGGYQLILAGHVALDASVRASIPFYNYKKVGSETEHGTSFEFVPSFRIGAGFVW